MNRRFFLKLFPAASAAAALPAVVALASQGPTPIIAAPLASKWQGDGLYEFLDGHTVKIMRGERWRAYDCAQDGPCYRFSPSDPTTRGGKVYCYDCALDAGIIRKIGEF